MPDNSIRAFAQLLARARAAIETPADLDDAARTAIIEDISAFEDCLARGAIPWGFDIHIGSIDHKHGTNHYAALTQEALMAEVAEYCREWWSDIDDGRDPATLDDDTIADIYFGDHSSEYLRIDRVRIDPPLADMQPSNLETGYYCVLTTAHLSTATASLLDEWCSAKPRPGPSMLRAPFTDGSFRRARWMSRRRPSYRRTFLPRSILLARMASTISSSTAMPTASRHCRSMTGEASLWYPALGFVDKA